MAAVCRSDEPVWEPTLDGDLLALAEVLAGDLREPVPRDDRAVFGKEKAEYSPIVTWDRLAEIAGQYLGKGQQVAIEGRLQTRSWDDDRGQRHWKTEIVASRVEMLSGRRKKDYEAQQAAESLTAQAEALGEAPASEPIPEGAEATGEPGDDDDDEAEAEEAAA